MPGTPQRHVPFFGSYAPHTANIVRARQAFSGWLQGWLFDPEVHDDMVVVLSELVANAIAATTEPLGELTVEASVDSRTLSLTVTNPPASTGLADGDRDAGDPLRPDGRGLIIVETLMDDVTIAISPGSGPLSVHCRRQVAVPAERKRDASRVGGMRRLRDSPTRSTSGTDPWCCSPHTGGVAPASSSHSDGRTPAWPDGPTTRR